MPGYIHDFANVKCTLVAGGVQFAVLGVTLKFEHNAPPEIICRAVPQEYPQRGKVVDSSDAPLFWKNLRDSDDMVGREDVFFSLTNLPGGRDFKAEGWVLGGVSTTASAGATAPEALDLQILHPIVMLEKYPSYAGPVKTNDADVTNLTGSTYLELFKSALENYRDRITDSAKQAPAFELLSEGIGRIQEFVRCEDCNVSSLADLFQGFNKERLENGFKRYIMSCIENGADNQTIFSLAMRAIATDLSLCLFVDERDPGSKQMILRPNIPYKPNPLNIKTNTLKQMTGNQGHWLAPTGVCTTLTQLVRPGYNHDKMPLKIDEATMSVICRDKGLQTIHVNAPVWFRAMLANAFGGNFNKIDDVESITDVDPENKRQMDALKKVLTQYFLELYRRSRQFSASRVFSLLDNDSKLLLPGRTCKVWDGKHKGILFLLESVEHKFSLQNNLASTELAGSYLRAEDLKVNARGADPEQIINNGFSEDRNYIWNGGSGGGPGGGGGEQPEEGGE